MRECFSVGCEQEGCSRPGKAEQRTTGNQSPQSFHLAQALSRAQELCESRGDDDDDDDDDEVMLNVLRCQLTY